MEHPNAIAKSRNKTPAISVRRRGNIAFDSAGPAVAPVLMSNENETVKLNLSRLVTVVAVLAGFVGLFGAFVILPHRVDAAEKRLESLESRQQSNGEVLSRIDERTQQILSRISALEQQKRTASNL
ncbi:MAG: hypothetical protein AB1705_21505 [Verrucomicrobiota bacterium]